MAGRRRFGMGKGRSDEGLWRYDFVVPEPTLPTVLATLRREVVRGVKVRTMLRRPGKAGG